MMRRQQLSAAPLSEELCGLYGNPRQYDATGLVSQPVSGIEDVCAAVSGQCVYAGGEIHWDYIRLALASVAKLAVIPVQDYLGLGNWARTNEPSTLGKNWRWRMKKDDLTPELIAKCREMAEIYGRAKKVQADYRKRAADKDTREMQEERPAEKEEKPTAKEERRSADEAPQ